MSFYANQRMFGYIRKAVAGIMVALIGASALQISIVTADSTDTIPAWGTILSIRPDIGAFVSIADTVVEPIIKEMRPETIKTIYMDATAYTSSPEETDADPFVTADGSDVRDSIIATNVLPFGTKVRIPTVYGDRIFEVHDRMNARYSYRVDVWMADKQEVRQFGLKRNIPIEVVEYGDNTTQWAARAEKIKQVRLVARKINEVSVK